MVTRVMKASDVVLASNMCFLGSVCTKGMGQLYWLQSAAKAQGRDGNRDAATNHLMLRLAENNLASSPSWLVFLACSSLFLLCLLTGTHCLYYWCSTFSVFLAEASFHCKRTSGSTSIHPHSFQEPVSFSMAPLSKVQGQFLIRLLLV